METDTEQSQCAVLRAHKPKSRIYSLAFLKGHIGTDGNTSIFPTYLGRPVTEVEKDFLVTVGYGREYQDIGNAKVFRDTVQKDGTFANIWLL